MAKCSALVPISRLRARVQFVRVREQGFRVPCKGFALQILPVAEEAGVQVGFTATTKTIGNAVARNRARRRLKTLIDKHMRLCETWNVGGFWLVVVARDFVLDMDASTLDAEMLKGLAQVREKMTKIQRTDGA